jgi:hypothetical protein
MAIVMRHKINVVTGSADDITDYVRSLSYAKYKLHTEKGRGPLGIINRLVDDFGIHAGWIIQRSANRVVSVSPRGTLPTGEDYISVPIEVKNDTGGDIEEGSFYLGCDVTIGGVLYTIPVVARGYVEGSEPVVIKNGETYTTMGLFIAKDFEGKTGTLYFTRSKPLPYGYWSTTSVIKAGEKISLTLSGGGKSGSAPSPRLPPIRGEIGGP